ncbi:MAG: FkbM family methyltransferase, partial [Selenomonadaceae bacterium]|nr:FkbM family methyltransferase [Selenomonadaceae bacterium]
NLKLLAFEPDAENFKMHRVNLILNDLDGVTSLVNCGLSNEVSELMLYNNGANTGARGFIRHEESTPISTVKIIPLDNYLAEHNIAAQEVKYIWIDTEGLEAQVMLGAKNLLKENPAPIFVEFNLGAWRKSGCFDELMTLLEGLYSHFILLSGGKETLYPIDAMRTLTPPNDNPLGRFGIGDIFLIKAGAII